MRGSLSNRWERVSIEMQGALVDGEWGMRGALDDDLEKSGCGRCDVLLLSILTPVTFSIH